MSANLLFLLKTVIIAIVEGITEFLPISSTGHMIIVGHFINFTGEYATFFEVVIQLGAILAIVVLYWKKISESLKPNNLLVPGRPGFKLWLNMIIAFIPAAVIGLVFKKKIDKYLFNTLTVAVAMIVGGTLLIIIENSFRKSRHSTRDLESVSPIQALKIGVFQCLSLWPGMSRSASTIMGGWVSGLSTPAAAEFSFFLAIPTMIAASGLDIIKDRPHMNSIELIALILGFIVSFLVALLVVEKFINFLKKKPMRVFAIYRILIGIVLLVLAALKVITITK
ncbi:undecaprenyl-diphosphate phosphatase [Clostridium sp. YIM B02515]|uniref:Undecaprenyl-diphosphatase n=1 Tax=Clostridium rhizosphaerae TaxID=2803861 RepID=A0ABS1TBB4_9CLOT|nr:undecaprenyl-diphosphate phosphatase [Clostridium rhizosphaerae]MBL4936644.1 undecaprenyl-diphosphate phosphatase [Clostridium rhizosphaerae]